MNLKRSSGREQLFWSISKWGTDFPERIKSITIGKDGRGQPLEIDQRLEEVTIGESWKRVSRCLLHRLVEMHPGDGFLPDMTPVINLIAMIIINIALIIPAPFDGSRSEFETSQTLLSNLDQQPKNLQF